MAQLDVLFHFKAEQKTEMKKKQKENRSWVCDFSPRGVDLDSFPYGIWKKLSNNILNEDNRILFSAGRIREIMLCARLSAPIFTERGA